MTRCNMVLWVEGLAGNQKLWILLSAQIVAFYLLMRSDSPFPGREATFPPSLSNHEVQIETRGPDHQSKTAVQ